MLVLIATGVIRHDHADARHRPDGRCAEGSGQTVRSRRWRGPSTADVAVRRWDWDQTYAAGEYRKLMLSYSARR